MSLPNEEGAGIPLSASLQGGRHSHQARNDSQPTQYFTTLNMLMECDEVCSSDFYRAYLPRFSVHIHRARRDGYVISKRQCDLRDHDHRGICWLYKLEALPELFP